MTDKSQAFPSILSFLIELYSEFDETQRSKK